MRAPQQMFIFRVPLRLVASGRWFRLSPFSATRYLRGPSPAGKVHAICGRNFSYCCFSPDHMIYVDEAL